MPKALTSNTRLQKFAASYQPIFLLGIDRDNPDTGASPIYICSWSGSYTIDGNVYVDRIMKMSDVRMAIPPGGGLAIVSDCILEIQNPENGGGRYSDMLDLYDLENDAITFSVVLANGSEVAADILTIFSGQIQDIDITTEILRLTSKDGSRSTLKTIPQDLADLLEFQNVPIDNVNTPLPVPFGDLNVEPWNATNAPVQLAPCVCVDFSGQYTPGRLNKTYGQPYVFYRTAGYYGKILDYTQAGAFFLIDSAARLTKIPPIRALATNDVTTFALAMDGQTATGATLANGSNLDLAFRGCPKIGTVTAISVVITASGGFNYTISKTGESNLTGSGSGNTTVSLASWDFSSNWDFELIELRIDGTGVAGIYEVTLDVAFLEQESGDRLAFPVFQAVVGYADVAAQYQDGAVINTANLRLVHPLDLAVAMFRDRRTGMRMPTAQIYTANLATERAKTASWRFDFSLTSALDERGLDEFLRQGKIRAFRTYDNLWKFSIFDKSDAPSHTFFDQTSITVQNPAAPPNEQRSTFKLSRTPLSQIYNEFVMEYGWDAALGVFTKILIESPYYRSTGTGEIIPVTGTTGFIYNATATFIADGIQVGYRVFQVRDRGYVVTAIPDENTLTIAVDGAGTMGSRTDTYYVGPNFNFQCFRSVARYKLTQRMPNLQSRYVWDDDTAQEMVDDAVGYWSTRRYNSSFRVPYNDAPDAELGDLVVVDHPDIPPRKRPVLMTVLTGPVLASDTVLPVDPDAGRLIREDDYMVLMPPAASGGLHIEIIHVTAVNVSGATITVTRAQAGTLARAWSVGDELSRTITKWEIVQLLPIPGDMGPESRHGGPEIEITARETPRHYTPVGKAAPNNTPTFTSCTAEQIAKSGFATWPDETANWLDEESALSYARN